MKKIKNINRDRYWFVPMADMSQTARQRDPNKRKKPDNPRCMHTVLYCCNDCNIVYQLSLYESRKLVNGWPEEYYPTGAMPTIGLERRTCLKCKPDLKEKANG